jgi:hypothetical protein
VTTRVLVVVALVALAALALQPLQRQDGVDQTTPFARRWAQGLLGSASGGVL